MHFGGILLIELLAVLLFGSRQVLGRLGWLVFAVFWSAVMIIAVIAAGA
jgi:hypothetical protein